jgi:hypothetical protein
MVYGEFSSSFALSAIVKDHGSDLDFRFVSIEKCKRIVVGRGNNRNFAFDDE